jgi:hypothetical protein
MLTKRARYAIEGKRPGSTLHIAGRFVKPDPDGGYVLSQAQKDALAKEGRKLTPVTGVRAIPVRRITEENAEPDPDSRAGKRLAQQRAAAEKINEQANRAPSKASAV